MKSAQVVSMLDRIFQYVSCISANYDTKGSTMSKTAYMT